MAVVSAAITSAIIAAGQATFPGSQNLPRIASAVGKSIPQWLPIPTNVLAQGATVGVAGAGTVQGKMFVLNGAALVVAGLNQVGINGPSAQGLGTAIGAGVASVLNSSMQYSGTSAGVGVGADVSKVSLSNSATLVGILLANLQAAQVNGQQAPRLASGLGLGIANLVQTGFGFGGVTGSPSPVPAVSTSISLVF
jgi:hypothetical protein